MTDSDKLKRIQDSVEMALCELQIMDKTPNVKADFKLGYARQALRVVSNLIVHGNEHGEAANACITQLLPFTHPDLEGEQL